MSKSITFKIPYVIKDNGDGSAHICLAESEDHTNAILEELDLLDEIPLSEAETLEVVIDLETGEVKINGMKLLYGACDV